uniref:Uncharacterized protein n=1 Tax=Oryza barthii TaxID=65489 RepID=A0A0D3F0V3_9ORYZ
MENHHSESPVRLPRYGEMCPSSRLEASETSVTVLSGLQVIPSHSQQSTPSFHDMLRPPSLESPVRKLRREFFSCSVHELVGEVKLSSSTRARLRTGAALTGEILSARTETA